MRGNKNTLLFDRDKLIPAFTIEMKLGKLPESLRSKIITHPEGFFACSRVLLWKLRYISHEDFKRGKWSPSARLLGVIADYFNCTVDSLYNRTQEKLIPVVQLEVIPENGAQLEIENASVTTKKKTA